MRSPTFAWRLRPALDWLLPAGAVALLLAIAVTTANALYQRTGAVYYPSVSEVWYSLTGLPPQVMALAAAGGSLLALWAGLRREGASWVVAACLALALSGGAFFTGRSPYQPMASATAGGRIYQLAADHANVPVLYLLFTCDSTGTLCHQVSAYIPYDLATGQHVVGNPTLTTDAAGHTLTLRVGTSVIGLYTVRPT